MKPQMELPLWMPGAPGAATFDCRRAFARLGLILHEREKERRRKAGEATTDDADLAERQAIARSVLAMLPDYDELAREANVE